MTQTLPEATIHPEDPDDEWLTSTNTGRTVRVRFVTGALALLAVLGGGFWGGVVAEKHHGAGTTTGATAASRFAAARAAAGGAGTGTGFAFGGGANATTGTIIDVSGDVVAISDSSGNIIKVTVGPATTVTRTTAVKASGLQIGDTVVVTGSTGSGGTVSATAIRATAPGVTAGAAGRGGFGG